MRGGRPNRDPASVTVRGIACKYAPLAYGRIWFFMCKLPPTDAPVRIASVL